jgi:RND family efflux transporter MFP subunit
MKQHRSGIGRPRIGSVAVCCLLLATAAGCGDSGKPPPVADVVRPVKTLVVAVPGAGAGMELPGQVRASQRVDLAFKEVSGRIVELPIDGREGEEILKGGLLAQIDPVRFEAALRSAEGSLNEALSVLDLASAEDERMAKMKGINPGLVSATMLDRTREKLKQAEARVEDLEAKVEKAEDRLEDTSLRAPFAGVIVRRLVDNFQNVQAGEPVVSLQDITHLEVLVDAPESMMAAARELGPDSISAVGRFPSDPGEEYPLSLKQAARTADSVTKTYRVVLKMPTPEGGNLAPGMRGTVTVSGRGPGIRSGRILIPAVAVMTDPDGGDYVWLVNAAELRVHRRDIQMGRLAGSDQVQVLGGLEGGERIVVAGVMRLSKGQPVRLWEDQDPGSRPQATGNRKQATGKAM